VLRSGLDEASPGWNRPAPAFPHALHRSDG